MPDLKVALIQSDLEWERIEKNLANFDAALNRIEGHVDPDRIAGDVLHRLQHEPGPPGRIDGGERC